jgi:hypothetical protein
MNSPCPLDKTPSVSCVVELSLAAEFLTRRPRFIGQALNEHAIASFQARPTNLIKMFGIAKA